MAGNDTPNTVRLRLDGAFETALTWMPSWLPEVMPAI